MEQTTGAERWNRQKNEFGLGAEGASASAGGQMKDWQRSGAEALSRGKEAASAAGAEAASSGASAVQSLRSEIKEYSGHGDPARGAIGP